MSGDRWIRRATSAVVVAVAAFAAVVSYSHIYDLARSHGQFGTAARLLPLSVDGLILAASLVLLGQARQGAGVRGSAATLARWMLGLGVAATVAANIAYGAAWGWLGALISAWPAIAFIGTAEMLIGLVRTNAAGGGLHARRSARPRAPASNLDAARLAFEASVDGGNPLAARALASRFGITRTEASELVAELAPANGRVS